MLRRFAALPETELRLIFSESESIECAVIFSTPDLNGYEKLITEPVDIQDFCWNGGRFHDYLPLTSLESGIVSMLIRDGPCPC